MVSRWTPVIRSIERMLDPPANALMIATCFDFSKMFVLAVLLMELLHYRNYGMPSVFVVQNHRRQTMRG